MLTIRISGNEKESTKEVLTKFLDSVLWASGVCTRRINYMNTNEIQINEVNDNITSLIPKASKEASDGANN